METDAQGNILYAIFGNGPEDARYKQISRTDSVEVTTYYVGKLLEWVQPKNLQNSESLQAEARTYIGDYLLSSTAIESVNATGMSPLRYLHKDALGSIDVITDQSGQLLERRSHDPLW